MLLRPDERADGVGVLAHRLAEQCGFDILALHGEDAVGWAQVERQPWARIRHVGYVVLGVDEDHQGRGLGASLLDAVVAEAASSGMSRLELTVMADNAPAVKLYLRHGFTIEGVRRNAIVRDGRSIDELYMGRLLKTGTQRER
jgi:RimJ/RimL family protein N-acetyltransferase